MERSEIRCGVRVVPDCASLHPGYLLLRHWHVNAFGWLLLGEPPTALQAAGLVTVLCGFYLAQRQR